MASQTLAWGVWGVWFGGDLAWLGGCSFCLRLVMERGPVAFHGGGALPIYTGPRGSGGLRSLLRQSLGAAAGWAASVPLVSDQCSHIGGALGWSWDLAL